MNSVISVALIALLAAATAQNCADKWEKTFDCVEKVKFSPEAQTLAKKRDAVMSKCVPNMPAQCTSVKTAGDRCSEQVAKDASLMAVRGQIKENVAKCFERFPSSAAPGMFNPPSGGFRSPPVPGQGPPPPGGPFAQGPDPCGPNSDAQAWCIKNETRNEKEAQEIAEKLDTRQKDCFKEVSDDSCRIDGNPQLGDCIEKAKQPFMQQGMVKMQECMQAAMNGTTTS